MYSIEKMANHLAARLSSTLKFDKDYEEVLAYGAFSILQTLNTIVFILLLGLLFKVPSEAFIISLGASILRKYSGGVHASTPGRCAILGVGVFVTLGILVKYLVRFDLIVNLFLVFACFGMSYFIISTKAPKDTPNKPLTDLEVRKNLRIKSLNTLHIFLLIAVGSLFMYYKGIYNYGLKMVLSLSFGAAWQSFTLSHLGYLIISYLDTLVGKISNEKEGKIS